MGAGRLGSLIEDPKRVKKRRKRSSILKKLEESTDSGDLRWRENFIIAPPITVLTFFLVILLGAAPGDVIRSKEFWSFSWTHCYWITYREVCKRGPRLFEFYNFKDHLLIGLRLRFALFPIEIILIDDHHPSPIRLFNKVRELHKKDYLLG